MTDIRNNPHFVLFPINNARTGYQPFAVPILYVEPRRVDDEGNAIPDSEALRVRYFVVDAPDPARVNGPFNQNIRIPDESLFEIELSAADLASRQLDLRGLLFFDPDGNEKSFVDAVEGDTFQYTMRGSISGSAPTSTTVYYPDAFYYDVSDVAIDVDQLPRPKNYFFVWESVFFGRIGTASGSLNCISTNQAVAQEIFNVSHPGDVHEYMFRTTPSVYFDFAGNTIQDDPTLAFYRPFADVLQDIFDEQGFLDGINQLDTIPAEYIPYLAFLIGWDLPNYPGATDSLKRSILRRGSELQKLKSSRRVLRELFEMFGFIVDIINLQADLTGNNLLGPGSGLETQSLTQTDLVLSDYSAKGFGVGTVPFVFRPIRDSQIVLYSWIVEDGSDKYNELLELSNNLSDDLEYSNINGSSFNINGVLEPDFVQSIGTSTTGGIIGYSNVVVGQGSTSNGRPVLNHRNISYDDSTNTIDLFFDHELSVDRNAKVFTFAVYQRLKIIIPSDLSNTRTNKFDIEFIDRQGLVVDFNLLQFLLDFVFNLKGFHSILRKITIPIRVTDVYNVTDTCVDGLDPFKPDTCLGSLQSSPAIIPNELTECQPNSDQGYKQEDLILRQLILDGLESEFQAWKSLADNCSLTPDGQDKVLDEDGIADAIEDAGTDDVNSVCSPDYDHRDDNRPTLCETDPTKPDFCYKGRVEQLLSTLLTVPNNEHYKCNPCGPSLGSVVYWEQSPNNVDLDGQNVGQLRRRLIRKISSPTSLHYTDDSYFSMELLNPQKSLAINPLNAVIEKDNLGFPSHRFLTMNRLESDYNYTSVALSVDCYDDESVYKRPWDDIAICGVFDTLNAELVDLTNGDQELVWDQVELIYDGNGLEPDIPSLSDHSATSDGSIITHKIYQFTEEGHPALTLDSTVITSTEKIDTSTIETGPIFDSVCDQNGLDFIGGYPAVTGFAEADRITYDDGDTSEDSFTFCEDSITCSTGSLDRVAIAEALCIESPVATDVVMAKYFGNSMKFIDSNDNEYKYYEPFRLDCSCLNEMCDEDVTSPTNPVQDVACNLSALYDDQGNLDTHCDKISTDLTVSLRESITLCDRLTDFDLPNLFCLNEECEITSTGQFTYQDDYGIIYEVEWVISEDTMDITVVTKDPRIPGEEPEGFIQSENGSNKIFRKGVITTTRQIIKIINDEVILDAEGSETEIDFFQTNIVCGDDPFDDPFAYSPDCALQADVAMLVVDGPHWVSPTEGVTDITFGFFAAAVVDEEADSQTVYKWTDPTDAESENDLVWVDIVSIFDVQSNSSETSSSDSSNISSSSSSGSSSSDSSDLSSSSSSGSSSSDSSISTSTSTSSTSSDSSDVSSSSSTSSTSTSSTSSTSTSSTSSTSSDSSDVSSSSSESSSSDLTSSSSSSEDFTPAELTNLQAWYDASDTGSLTVDSENRVSQWNDLSGNGFHLAQSTNSRKPLSGVLTRNGLNVLKATAGSKRMDYSGGVYNRTGSERISIWIVAQNKGSVMPTTEGLFNHVASSGPKYLFSLDFAAHNGTGDASEVNWTFDDLDWRLYEVEYDDTSNEFFFEGVSQDSASFSSVGDSTHSFLRIIDNLEINIAEIVVAKDTTASEKDKMRTKLIEKWKLTLESESTNSSSSSSPSLSSSTSSSS